MVAGLTLGACSSDGDPDAGASRSPSSSPSPTAPTIEPIEPQVAMAARSVNSGAVIDRSQGAAPDDAAVQALADGVRTWLDGHLDDLQNGGEGTLAAVALEGLLADADPGVVDSVTTGLTSPEDPVRGADYAFEVGHDGAPRWLRADVTVTRHSGGTSQATFVFVPGDQGPVLIGLGPVGGAA